MISIRLPGRARRRRWPSARAGPQRGEAALSRSFMHPAQQPETPGQSRISPASGQHVAAPGVTMDDDADAIALVTREPGEERCRFRSAYPLEAVTGTELHGGTGVQHQPEGAFPLLLEELGVHLAGARGDLPIDDAEVVAPLVGAHLIELDAATAKARTPGAGKKRLYRATGEKIQFQGLAVQVPQASDADTGTRHLQGTGTRSNRRSITSSLVTPSASAS